MPFRQDHESDQIDREILNIIPERYDADPDSQFARKTAHTRLILTAALALLATAALGVAAKHIFFSPKQQVAAGPSVPVISADDKPIKTKPAPEDRGGMEVPNRDKLVYDKIAGGGTEGEPQSERLLPPPETPADPPVQQPRTPTIKPAFEAPPAKEINTANLPPEAPKASAPTPPALAPAAPALPPPAATAPAAPPQAAKPAATTAPAKPAATAATTAPAKPAAPAPAPAAHDAKAAAPAKPAAAPAPAAPAKPAAPVKSAGGGWHVQLGSLKSEGDAKAEWNHIHTTNKDVLGSLPGNVVRADLGVKGVYWRIYAGPMDEAAARTVCAHLSKRNQGCIIGKE